MIVPLVFTLASVALPLPQTVQGGTDVYFFHDGESVSGHCAVQVGRGGGYATAVFRNESSTARIWVAGLNVPDEAVQTGMPTGSTSLFPPGYHWGGPTDNFMGTADWVGHFRDSQEFDDFLATKPSQVHLAGLPLLSWTQSGQVTLDLQNPYEGLTATPSIGLVEVGGKSLMPAPELVIELTDEHPLTHPAKGNYPYQHYVVFLRYAQTGYPVLMLPHARDAVTEAIASHWELKSDSIPVQNVTIHLPGLNGAAFRTRFLIDTLLQAGALARGQGVSTASWNFDSFEKPFNNPGDPIPDLRRRSVGEGKSAHFVEYDSDASRPDAEDVATWNSDMRGILDVIRMPIGTEADPHVDIFICTGPMLRGLGQALAEGLSYPNGDPVPVAKLAKDLTAPAGMSLNEQELSFYPNHIWLLGLNRDREVSEGKLDARGFAKRWPIPGAELRPVD